MKGIFFTGFPGFLGAELVPRVLHRAADARVVCLVQPKFAALARQRANEIEQRDPSCRGRIRIVEGDIAQKDLGLPNAAALARDTNEIFHLAAVYDLSVGRELAMKVNVEGTRNVLAFAERVPDLRRLQHVSTCYVSGRHPGRYTERDLDVGQTFNNFYEESKFLAERVVHEAMKSGMKGTVYRPAIVVGDSHTGATQKYDGPYYVIRWVLRQPKIAFVPVIGRPKRFHVNIVPRDYVVGAIDSLSGMDVSAGKVYQLADPEPLSVDRLLHAIADATAHRIVRVPVPPRLAKGAIDRVPGVYGLMKIPSSAIDYFVHPTEYTNIEAVRDVQGSAALPPHVDEYLPILVDFVRRHPEITSEAMA
jgi:thioester reductase-like protein